MHATTRLGRAAQRAVGMVPIEQLRKRQFPGSGLQTSGGDVMLHGMLTGTACWTAGGHCAVANFPRGDPVRMTPELTVLRIESLEALRRYAPAWDDLWARSEVTHPTAQADLIACWLEHFQHHDRFAAIVVQRGGRFLAALPLVTHSKGGVVTCMDVPGNEWSSAGQLLLDPQCNTSAVCQLLVHALATLDCAGFWFASVPIHAKWWQALMAAARSELECRCAPAVQGRASGLAGQLDGPGATVFTRVAQAAVALVTLPRCRRPAPPALGPPQPGR